MTFAHRLLPRLIVAHLLLVTVLAPAQETPPTPGQSSPDPGGCLNPPGTPCTICCSSDRVTTSESRINHVGLLHQHVAWDYRHAPGMPAGAGCVPCGSAGGNGGGNSGLLPADTQLPRVGLERIHSYRWLAQHSSLGPGVFLDGYDVSLELSTGATLLGSRGRSTIRVIDPANFETSISTYDTGVDMPIDLSPARQVLSRIEPTVDHDWGVGSPDLLVPADRFAARWSGTLTIATAGAYTFTTQADDGVRLFVDGVAVIDHWSDHPLSEDGATRTLAAGAHQLRLEYYDGLGSAACHLLWAGPGIAKQVIPASVLTPAGGSGQGLSASYFAWDTNVRLVGRSDPVIDFAWGRSAPDPALQGDHFVARWSGFLTPPADASYTLYALADDGVRLWVDGTLVIDQWHDGPATEYSAVVALSGHVAHALRLEYYDNTGSAAVRLSWSSSAIAKQVVPAAVLTQDNGSAPGLSARLLGLARTDPRADGRYFDDVDTGTATRSIGEVRLLDAQGRLTPDQALATRAVMTTRQGQVYTFEIFRTDPDPLTTERLGRLVRLADRNGNAQVLSYRYAVTSDPALAGGDLARLWQLDRIGDPYGQQLVFTYAQAQVAGRWVVARIDLPNGQHVAYQYGNAVTPGMPTAIVGLSGVDLPGGDHARIVTSYDAATQAEKVVYDDPAAEGTHRHKTLYLTGTSYRKADGSVVALASGRVRAVVNGAGETSFLTRAWSRPDGLQATIIYRGGKDVLAVVHAGGRFSGKIKRFERAVTWDFNTDPATWTWEVTQSDATYDAFFRILSETDGLGRTTAFAVDAVTGLVLQTTWPDATTTTSTWNQFSQPLLQSDRLGRRTRSDYDASGNRLARTVAVGTPDAATWRWRYAADGQVLDAFDADFSAAAPDLHLTSYVYDANHLLVARVAAADAPGQPRPVWSYGYDAFGRLASLTDPVGRVVTYAYDERNRVRVIGYADGSQETITYGSGVDANLVTRRTDRNGDRLGFTYDAHGRLSVATVAGPAASDPVIGRTVSGWLVGTTILASTDLDGDVTAYTHDHRNREVAVTRRPTPAVTLVSTTVFDGFDHAVVEVDAYGRRTLQVFDINDRIVRRVRELVVGGYGGATSQAALAALARPGTANPPYVIEDRVVDAEGQDLARTDGRGIVQRTAYDAQGRVSEQVEADRVPSGATTVPAAEAARTLFRYDAQGNQTAVILPRSFARLADGTWVAGGEGEFRTTTTWNGRNLMATRVTADGVDAAGGVRPERAPTAMGYTPTGKLSTRSDPREFTTTFLYADCCDRLVQQTDPEGGTTKYLYDGVGNVTQVTDGNGNATSTTYDARQRVLTVTNAEAETTRYAYDEHGADGLGLDAQFPAAFAGTGLGTGADGSAVAMTDALGATVLEVRDGLGRVIASMDGNGFIARMAYDGITDGLVVTTDTDPLNHSTSIRCDALGGARIQLDAAGQATRQGFDADGNLVSARDPNGVGVDCVLDARNRVRRCTDTAGATTLSDFDAHGNLVTLTDALHHAITCTFDGNDRKRSSRDRVAALTRFAYDLSGNLLQIVDAEGGVTDYTHDGRNLPLSETVPTGQQGRTRRTFAYDAGLRLIGRTVAIAGAPPGSFQEQTQYRYDRADRLVERAYPQDGLNDVYTHDAAGRLLSARSNRYGNTVVRTYDVGGRLSTETMTFDAGSLSGGGIVPLVSTIGYRYDAADRLTQTTYPDRSQLVQSYTVRDQVETISHAGASIATRGYDAGARLVSTRLGNGLVETRTYRTGDNLIAAMGIPGVTGFGYSYDDNKRKQQEVDQLASARTQQYGFDAENRLTSWNRSTVETQGFRLSPVGDFSSVVRNGQVESRTHTAAHETTSLAAPGVGLRPLGYDAKGNLTRDEHGTVLAWDPEDRLRLAQVRPGSDLSWSGTIATYGYDAMGRRVEKTVGNRTTRFLHDDAQVVQEIEQFAVPAAGTIAGDGSTANAAAAPASGGILPGAGVTRINMQPATSVIPSGYFADKGRALGVRSNGSTYGWEVDAMADTVSRGSAVPLIEFDTFMQLQPAAGTAHTWSLALPDGSYPVVVVCGDPLSANQTNHLQIADQAVTDPTPAVATAGYQRGNFDGYAVQATVSGGRLRIAPRSGAFNAKLCFLEIGPKGATIDQATRDRLDDLIEAMNAATWEEAPTAVAVRRFVHGTYVDDLLAILPATGGTAARMFVHGNHLHSVAALTDGAGAVLERYRHDAYGQRTVLAPDGLAIRMDSAHGNQIGFTGRQIDAETGLMYYRARMFDPALGRFIGRDKLGHVDSFNLYSYVADDPADRVDPTGLESFELTIPQVSINLNNPNGNGPIVTALSVVATGTYTVDCPAHTVAITLANVTGKVEALRRLQQDVNAAGVTVPGNIPAGVARDGDIWVYEQVVKATKARSALNLIPEVKFEACSEDERKQFGDKKCRKPIFRIRGDQTLTADFDLERHRKKYEKVSKHVFGWKETTSETVKQPQTRTSDPVYSSIYKDCPCEPVPPGGKSAADWTSTATPLLDQEIANASRK